MELNKLFKYYLYGYFSILVGLVETVIIIILLGWYLTWFFLWHIMLLCKPNAMNANLHSIHMKFGNKSIKNSIQSCKGLNVYIFVSGHSKILLFSL